MDCMLHKENFYKIKNFQIIKNKFNLRIKPYLKKLMGNKLNLTLHIAVSNHMEE